LKVLGLRCDFENDGDHEYVLRFRD
jgi:hypothetical protein